MGKLLVLMFTAFVDMVGSSMILPLLPFYAQKVHASGLLLGVIVAAFSAAQMLSAPTWGRFSDRYGRRPAVLLGLVISGIAYVVFAFAGSVTLLLVSRFVQGIGAGTVGVLQAYVADAIGEEDRAKSLGWLSAATSFGVVVGPAFGSLLSRAWGDRAPGLGAALLCGGVAIFAWRWLRESRELMSTVERKRVAIPPAPGAARAALTRVVTHAGEPAPRLVWIYAIAIGAFYGNGQLMPVILADRFGVTEANVGWYFMYFGLMGVLIRALLLGRVVGRWREARTVRAGVVLLGAGLCAMAFAHSYWSLWVAFTLMPLGTAFLFPCVTALLSRVVPPAERGLHMGVQQTYGGISRVAFPIGAGLLLDHFSPGVPFLVAGVMVFGTMMLTGALERYMAPATVA